MDIIEKTIVLAKRGTTKLGLLFIDLDKFKSINDNYGHIVGDELLKVVTQRIKESISEEDVAARLGGDEFLVLLNTLKTQKDEKVVAEKILFNLQKPIIIKNNEIHITASIGLALFPSEGETLDQLITVSDNAMYKAKDLGGNTFYCESLD